jgi:hypothetical protein
MACGNGQCDMNTDTGQLRKDFYVHCGRCAQSQYGLGSNAGAAEDELRRRGWHIRRSWGWICPTCFRVVVPELADTSRAEKREGYR